jgi:hypothetical protein
MKPVHIALAAAGVGVAGFAAWRVAQAMPSAENAGAAVGSGVVNAAAGVATGAVLATGDVFGLPRTSPDACAAAIAAGDMWEASKVCPAGDFLSAAWRKATTTINADAIDNPFGGASGGW